MSISERRRRIELAVLVVAMVAFGFVVGAALTSL